MYALVDVTNSTVIARHDSGKALQGLAFIQFANVDCVVLHCATNRSFSMLSREQLVSIAEGMQLEVSGEYIDVLNAVRQAIMAAEHLHLPFSLGQIEAQAYALHSSDDKPYTFDPQGSTAKLSARWHFDPQRNRKRIDSSFGTVFRAGVGYGEGVVPAHMAAQLQGRAVVHDSEPAPRSQPRPAPTTPKEPKAPRAPASAPSGPPKAGATARVWTIAGEVYDLGDFGGDMKVLRKRIVEACTAEGINPSTASVQYGKWKSSKGL